MRTDTDLEGQRTTNDCEIFHGKFTDMFEAVTILIDGAFESIAYTRVLYFLNIHLSPRGEQGETTVMVAKRY